MKTKSIFAFLLIVSFLAACTQATPSASYPPPGSISATTTTAIIYPGPTVVASPIPTVATMIPAEQAAVDALSKKYNIPVGQISIVSTEAVTWTNGCLDVVIPGVLCTDVMVDGYRIIMEAIGQQYEFHANLDGTNVMDASQQLATLQFVVRTPGQAVTTFTPDFSLGPTYNPAFNGFLPVGGSINGIAYVYDAAQSKVLAVDTNGEHELPFIQSPTYGLAIWRGGLGSQPILAWGTQLYPADSSALMIANPDGSNQETLLTISSTNEPPVQIVAETWSADGQSLYFSKEPVGIGGYILFSGASNLYKVDIHSKEVTEIIPQASPSGPQTCLDAISGDYRNVADHCVADMITIRDLQSGTLTTIQAPSGFTSYKVMGSTQFSPAGDRVAFAMAKNNPDDEQGWVAIGNTAGGTANIILTSGPGEYYTVQGWLDDQTLLVQSFSVGNPGGVNQIWTISADGSVLTKISDGTFLTLIDNR
ncbi:MAG: hypothetical protein C3F13_06425 [Anaerolineales bacterium]|nr:hypothetical protein [Anaerolineae bacterium]PWB54648.1 MAG: hypothetical protein C3F13_06425 [Anaerolineales bacterium]